ncbi:radical SAM family heme chaperone HemW [Buchnera aphidicola]|uniref:Heme chaperone HemW n=1 Tax=Buchnera aphidicola subsp. Rhopalosiphum maidis TaxID=118109 RepID=A0A3G2I5X1_BUCRM|nr:radical SAM family heme chaperone HemW [Buchnera aphidicola]AYN24541.1 radical SAM family heme chaperone HemW [Buchnera aphidicola (Rhopalosiphum maidis)]
MFKLPPISLYIHIPWCLKKCGYCDFYSYVSKSSIPEKKYIEHLLKDLEKDLNLINGRVINSIFIGGGTPSLLKSSSIEKLLKEIKKRINISNTAEITIEANPTTLEYKRFFNYKKAGVNRFSIGVQTFNSNFLKKIERTYNKEEAILAIEEIRKINKNFNLDIMYGLPNQSLQDVLSDLKYAVKYSPTHISWYQLTIEPNTLFYIKKLNLPNENIIFKMSIEGDKFLKKSGYKKYEISSYSKLNYECKHNLNYWNFGDYIGIGCSAHGKITQINGDIIRTIKNKNINDFINGKYLNYKNIILKKEKPLEYFMNVFRLYKPVLKKQFQERTNIDESYIKEKIKKAIEKGYIKDQINFWNTTHKGKTFLNSLLKIFLN